MEVSQLKTDMDRQFVEVAEHFKDVRKQFEWVDLRFKEVDQRFERIDRRFEEMIALILSEGDRTRRHFDVVVEQLTSERNLSIDKATAVDERVGRLTAANAADHVEFGARLDNHEQRLTDLEPKSKP